MTDATHTRESDENCCAMCGEPMAGHGYWDACQAPERKLARAEIEIERLRRISTPIPLTPSDEMVEAGARALAAYNGDDPDDIVRDGVLFWTRWKDDARACLQAALNLMGGKK